MSTRNPFRTLERVGRIIGYSILFAFFAFAVVAIGVQAAINLGWWALLLIIVSTLVFYRVLIRLGASL